MHHFCYGEDVNIVDVCSDFFVCAIECDCSKIIRQCSSLLYKNIFFFCK